MPDGHGHDSHGGGHEQSHEEHTEEHAEEHSEEHDEHKEHEGHTGERHEEHEHKHEEHAKPKEEKKKTAAPKKKFISESDLLALIIIASVGRVITEPFPSVEPIIPIAVYAGLVYGVDAGIIIGLVSSPISNIFMEGGPFGLWTLLQATGGAISGGLAGYANKATKGNLLYYSVIGTFIFEFAVNLGDGLLLVWPFSFTHIVSNAIFAILLGELLIKEK